VQLAREFGAQFVAAALEEFFLWDGVPEGYEQTEECPSFEMRTATSWFSRN
jgi:hypothetical protein